MGARRNRDFMTSLEAELKLWPAVGYAYVAGKGGRHDRLYLTYGNSERFITLSNSPGDWRANKKRMRDARNTLIAMGATRRRSND